jgi:hypothetical protein
MRHCRYPADQVPKRTYFRPRQKARYASTCCHVPPRYQNSPRSLWRAPTLPHVQGSGPPPPPPRRAPALPRAQMLRTPPPHPGGLWHCYMPRGSGPHLVIWEGSDAATHPLALIPAMPLRRGSALTHILRLWTAPTSVVGFDADTCPMTLHGRWAVEIKEGLATTACSEARVFLRHARTLPRCLQDVWADDVIMTCKPYE